MSLVQYYCAHTSAIEVAALRAVLYTIYCIVDRGQMSGMGGKRRKSDEQRNLFPWLIFARGEKKFPCQTFCRRLSFYLYYGSSQWFVLSAAVVYKCERISMMLWL